MSSPTTTSPTSKATRVFVLAACLTTIALGACRREEPVQYVPMKLGGETVDTVKK